MMAENEVSCDVIADLLPAFVEGEASADSRSLVESHLEHCEDCRELVEEARQGGRLLAAGGAGKALETGATVDRAVLRFRRRLLVLSGLIFGGLALGLAVLLRVVARSVIDVALPRPDAPVLGAVWWVVGLAVSGTLLAALVVLGRPGLSRRWGASARVAALALALPTAVLLYILLSDGSLVAWLIFGGLSLLLHAAVLTWRRSLSPARSAGSDFLRSAVAGLPLAVLALGTVNSLLLGASPAGTLGAGFLLVALGLTWSRLEFFPRAATIVMVVFLLASGLLAGRGAATALDLVAQDGPAGPPLKAGVEEAIALDLSSLDLKAGEPVDAGALGGITLPSGAEAASLRYEAPAGEGIVTVVRFADVEAAEALMASWASSLQAELWTTATPDRGEGRRQMMRGYDGTAEVAYAAWQQRDWVLIVESPGRLTRAVPRALEILEAVGEQWEEFR